MKRKNPILDAIAIIGLIIWGCIVCGAILYAGKDGVTREESEAIRNLAANMG